jgi:hypothetical protein
MVLVILPTNAIIISQYLLEPLKYLWYIIYNPVFVDRSKSELKIIFIWHHFSLCFHVIFTSSSVYVPANNVVSFLRVYSCF